MGVIKDKIGQKFGKLTVVSFSHLKKQSHWNCLCDCGNEKTVSGGCLTSGRVQSCGCLHKEILVKGTGIRGDTRLYNIYKGMKKRCYNPNNHAYGLYGCRGIDICDDWLKDFEEFKAWSLANGYSDDLSIDRIDNERGYRPDNCRWITHKKQSNNRRDNRILEHQGQQHTLTEWANIKGISREALRNRLNKGWPVSIALEEPPRKRTKK